MVNIFCRGGYCFEQNILLAAALRTLGYDFYTAAGRVVVWDQIIPGSTQVRLYKAPSLHQLSTEPSHLLLNKPTTSTGTDERVVAH